MTFTEAFAKYGATLRNPQWSMSALAIDGSLVVGLYANWFKKGDQPRTLTYSDRLSAWKGNEPGRNEFQRLLQDAKAQGAAVRVVLAHPHPSQAHLVGQVRTKAGSRRRSLFGKTGWAPLNTLMATNIASRCVRSRHYLPMRIHRTAAQCPPTRSVAVVGFSMARLRGRSL